MSKNRQEEQFAGRVRTILDQGVADLGENARARLYQSRVAALRCQAVPVAGLGVAGIGHLVAEAVHHHYRGILAFLALAVGALGVNLWHNYQQAAELAEIDSALLADEVSPGAYLDQGFLAWLDSLSQQGKDSLPE
jgi:hypothetical protein